MCDVLGGRWRDALSLASAVELIHTASLIHDDILDGSQERRGKPAAHIKFGKQMALLAGDMLYFAAVEAADSWPGAVKILNLACRSMCLGEVTRARVEADRLKGGSLFRAAAELGALPAHADPALFKMAGEFGEKLGTAYQLRDDVLDGEATVQGDDLASQACKEISRLPASAAKELLVQLAWFACRRPS